MAERLVVEDGWIPLAGSYEEVVLSWQAQWERVFSRRAAAEPGEDTREVREEKGRGEEPRRLAR